jgi:hypothetical protein
LLGSHPKLLNCTAVSTLTAIFSLNHETKEGFSRFDPLRLLRQSTTLLLVDFKTLCSNRRIKSRQKVRLVASLLTGLCLGASAIHAQDATWVGVGGGPQLGQWNAHQNWGRPGNSIPTGTAIFQDHTPTSVTISLTSQLLKPPTNIGTSQFNAGALAYSFTNNTIFNDTSSGIVNNSASQQTFINNSYSTFLTLVQPAIRYPLPSSTPPIVALRLSPAARLAGWRASSPIAGEESTFRL